MANEWLQGANLKYGGGTRISKDIVKSKLVVLPLVSYLISWPPKKATPFSQYFMITMTLHSAERFFFNFSGVFYLVLYAGV